ncbi:MAG: hypothetical protein COT84_05260 [Chlamydiae bacterium CG10_big_fil_rev_8_21_14_0_10_35_9]|nr:MAG: hypothetical protein COT84_05260 [Chlamydiae bacterium CG10_big_fil_rev_8_21_14_0_10_35_9]
MKINENASTTSQVKKLFNLSLPLMISSLATLLMIFVDRIFLANYSIDTLNAAVSAGTLAWAFLGGFGMITAMSQVFVSQYNGSNQQKEVGKAVWQMIWVGIFSLFLFVPMAFFAAPFIYKNSPHQISYFFWLMIFAPGYALMTALSGFYIGREKTKLLILLALVANLINIALDRAFIFGVEGVVPEMGIKGAAIATCTGYLVQAFILLLLFLKKIHKETYGTNHWKIHKPLFLKSLKVGAPQGIFYGLEIVGWAVFFEMMSKVSFLHITVSSICQSIIILLSFFMDGLTRGVASIAGNFIGAKKYDLISKVFRAGITLQIGFSLILALLLTLDPKVTLSVFFPVTNSEFVAIQDGFSEALQVSLIFVFFYITFEGFRWVISGLLSAAGDTLFLLIAGAGSVWVFLLLPVYLIVVRYSQPIEWAWATAFFYSVITYAIYYFRYVKGKWKNIVLIEDSQLED